jgi:hypothetical protein
VHAVCKVRSGYPNLADISAFSVASNGLSSLMEFSFQIVLPKQVRNTRYIQVSVCVKPVKKHCKETKLCRFGQVRYRSIYVNVAIEDNELACQIHCKHDMGALSIYPKI